MGNPQEPKQPGVVPGNDPEENGTVDKPVEVDNS